MIANGRGEANPMPVTEGETMLKGAEQTLATGNGEDHTAQFAQKLLPPFDGHAMAPTKGGKEVQEAGGAMRGQGDCVIDGVHEPTQHDLERGPGSIALLQFFDRDWLGAMRVGGREGGKNGVDRMQQMTPNGAKSAGWPLGDGDEVIDVDVDVCHRARGGRQCAMGGRGQGGKRSGRQGGCREDGG